MEDMKSWLITNNHTNPTVGIAARYDLDSANPRTFGLTDCKIVEMPLAWNPYIWAFSGPTMSNGKFPAF
jgi:hypothetical protein